MLKGRITHRAVAESLNLEFADPRRRAQWFAEYRKFLEYYAGLAARRELLRDRRQIIGRIDSRYLGTESDAAGEGTSYDPQAASISGATTPGCRYSPRASMPATPLPQSIATFIGREIRISPAMRSMSRARSS